MFRMKQHFYGFLFATTVMFSLSSGVSGQEVNTLYHMRLPQTNLMNPASQQYCNFYLNLPLAGATSVSVSSSSVSFSDLVFYGTGEYSDSLITILHPSYNIDDFLSKLQRKNYLAPSLATNILSFGFRSRNLYFHFGIMENASFYLGYPKDMMVLLFKGNVGFAGKNADLTSMTMDATLYGSLGMGVSARVTDALSLGVRAKFLSGVVNGSLKNHGTYLTVDEDDYTHTLEADLSMNFSAPVEITTDSAGNVTDISLQDDFDTPENIIYYLLHPDNPGFAFDVGAEYRIGERWLVSASVLDLGMIRWRRDVSNLVSKGSFIFRGIDASPLFEADDTSSFEDLAEELLDSLADVFDPVVEHTAYTTTLAPKLYVGGTFGLTPWMRLGVLSRSEFQKKNVIQSFTFSANASVKRWLNFTVSYTLANNAYDNLGAGLSLRAGPVQFYLMTDYALGYVHPDQSKALGGWFGLNLLFGCKERVMDDLPLIH